MTKALIIGATGFVGSHLAEYLKTLDHVEVWGTKRRRSDLSNLQVGITLIDCEITDYCSVDMVIDQVRPDWIFHLAAQSFVPTSWVAPHLTFETNALAPINLFEAVRKIKPDARVQVAGSSEEYGFVAPEECPITEEQPLRPMSPYGASKAAMDLLAQQYVRSYGLHIVITRAFNHTGPRRGEAFVTSNFAKQIAQIEAGTQEPLVRCGNLDARRDWTDVRDIVKAYVLAIQHCQPGTPYNICSSRNVRIGHLLDLLLDISGVNAGIHPDPKRMRPSDVPLFLGSSKKFRQLTGWKPTIPFRQTLQDLLDYWRQRIS